MLRQIPAGVVDESKPRCVHVSSSVRTDRRGEKQNALPKESDLRQAWVLFIELSGPFQELKLPKETQAPFRAPNAFSSTPLRIFLFERAGRCRDTRFSRTDRFDSLAVRPLDGWGGTNRTRQFDAP